MSVTDVPLLLAAEHDQRHFRLLELPPELIELITNGQDGRLELKSSSSTAGHDQQPDAVLCTHDKTYKIRQQNTSNAVYTIETSPEPQGVIAIAQCGSTLELMSSTNNDATAHVRRLVPLYSSSGTTAPHGPSSKRELFDSIPLSENECQIAYNDLAIATQPQTGQLIRPSARVKVDIWRNILDTALADGLDIHALEPAIILSKLATESSSTDLAVAQAVLTAAPFSEAGAASSVLWIGRNLLEVEALHSAIPAEAFLARWRDLLPEKWRAQAVVPLLGDYAVVEESGRSVRCNTVRFIDSVSGVGVKSESSSSRRWHDKFRSGK